MEGGRMRHVLEKALCLILLLPSIAAISQYNISTTFNGEPVSPSIANFTLDVSEDGQSLILTVRSVFNGDPAPPVDGGAYFRHLYRYEAAEVYFANDDGQYFQVQISPYGQYVTFLFTEYRKSSEVYLPLNVTSSISEETSTWYGVASVPLSYLPPKVTKFNVNYIGGVEPNRQFYSYSPAPETETEPDFHKLEYFAPIDLDALVTGLSERPTSEKWTNILQKPLKYQIYWSWNATLLKTPTSAVSIDSLDENTLTVEITSPFSNDSPPNAPDNTRTAVLWQYEAAEVFFANSDKEFFQVMVGPRGHYFSAMYSDAHEKVRMNIFLNVSTKISRDRKSWTAVIEIPTTYLPPNVTSFNAFYTHGEGERRTYTAYAPAFYSEPHADYHRLKYFTAIYLDKVISGLSGRPKSQAWIDVTGEVLRYQILTDYFNKPVTHAPANITISSTEDGNVLVTFESVFLDYTKPPAPENSRISDLWNYERAEIYFSNKEGEYMNVLLGPYGHYAVHLFSSYRTIRNHNLALEVSAVRDTERNTWKGSVIIPVRSFPHKVSNWNAYYAQGDRPEVVAEALGPNYYLPQKADFHQLDIFPGINLDFVIPGFSEREESQYWRGALVYDILSTWNGEPITHVPTTFTLDSFDPDTLTVSVSSLFYGDPAPPVPENSSYVGIWQYELAEIFFANDRDEYFQLEFGPYGQYQALMLAGERVYKRYQLPVEITTSITDGTWTGTVSVPTEYLPEKVTTFNCYYSHGVSPDRVYEAYRADPLAAQPDYHNLDNFAPIDLDEVIPDLSSRAMSDIWSDALQGKITYEIMTLWNGDPIDHDPIRVILEGTATELYFNIDAPFFNDPPPPCPVGEPCNGLWDYEVVEAFFLNDENQYLEVEVGPYGQHLVLLLWTKNDTYNQMRHSLPMEVTTTITGDRWTGRATIPVDYFPPKVTKFNAYDKHYPPPNRQEESLYPQDPTDEVADFHALEYFKPIDFNTVVPDQSEREMSQLWVDTINGIFRYEIETEWNSVPISHSPVTFTLEGFEGGVEINVTAPFFNDPPPPGGVPGQPYYGLWDYEVAEMFFLNDNDEYLEVELGPYGEHLLLLLKGERNTIKHSLALDFVVTSRENGTGDQPGVWQGSALIPPTYFPPNVTRMNAYAIHGTDDTRVYEALYPAPNGDPDYPAPDFHALELFQPMDFEFLVVDNTQYSDIWLDAIANPVTPPSVDDSAAVRSDAVQATEATQTSSIGQDTPSASVDQTSVTTETTAASTQDETALGQDATVTEATETISFTDATTVQGVTDSASNVESFTRTGEALVSVDISTTTEPTSTTAAKADNIPQPELVKEGRHQDISKPTENLFRPLVIRPSGVKPKPSKLDEKDPAKFANNPTVGALPPFFPRPHFPPPSFFSPQQQFNPNLGQVSPYSTGFSLPLLPNQNSGQPQQFLPPQPHLQHLIHHHQTQLSQTDPLSEQQVVHPLPTPGSAQFESSAPDSAVAPMPLTVAETPVAVPEKEEVVVQTESFVPPPSKQTIPILPNVIDQISAQERKLSQHNTVLLPEQSLQASIPQQTLQVQPPNPVGTRPLIPQAIPTHFPPPHNICFSEGIHPDPHRCPIFHECIYENHEWKVYTWRCPRGKYYDAKLQDCVAGFC